MPNTTFMHDTLDRAETLIPCIGCGALVPDTDGPTFRYPDTASPGCWAVFGEILARDYGEFRHRPVHHLAVDAYAVQHPGRPTPHTIQSVTVHLISLCAVLERGYASGGATWLMRRAIGRFKGDFVWLEPPTPAGEITVLEVVGASDLSEHVRRTTRWTDSVWKAWAGHHDAVRCWVNRLEGL
jgi:hypothetical protein